MRAIKGFVARHIPWPTIEAATGIDEATFRRLRERVDSEDSATKAPPDAPARSGSPQSNVFGSVAAGTADDELVGVTPLEVMARLRDELAVLDQYYVPTRYPNGLPGGIPSDVYTRAQASAVVDIACRIVAVVRRELAVSSGGHDASAPAEGGPLPDATASPQGTAAASESPPEEEHGAPEGGGGE